MFCFPLVRFMHSLMSPSRQSFRNTVQLHVDRFSLPYCHQPWSLVWKVLVLSSKAQKLSGLAGTYHRTTYCIPFLHSIRPKATTAWLPPSSWCSSASRPKCPDVAFRCFDPYTGQVQEQAEHGAFSCGNQRSC